MVVLLADLFQRSCLSQEEVALKLFSIKAGIVDKVVEGQVSPPSLDVLEDLISFLAVPHCLRQIVLVLILLKLFRIGVQLADHKANNGQHSPSQFLLQSL